MISKFKLAISFLALLGLAGLVNQPSAEAQSNNKWSFVESPTCQRLNAVWGNSPDDIFAVGKDGTIIRYDGSSWKFAIDRSNGGPNGELFNIHGNGGSDFTVSGDDQWEAINQRWRQVYWETSYHKRTFSKTAVWKRQFGGSELSGSWNRPFVYEAPRQVSPDFTGVTQNDGDIPIKSLWGLNNEATFAGGGRNGTSGNGGSAYIFKWDGARWNKTFGESSNETGNIVGLWGNANNNFWAVGTASIRGGSRTVINIYRYNGSNWSLNKKFVDSLASPGHAFGIWGLNSNHLWVNADMKDRAVFYNGSSWNDAVVIRPDNYYKQIPTVWRDIWGSAADNLWAVGDDGRIAHYGPPLARIPKLTPCEEEPPPSDQQPTATLTADPSIISINQQKTDLKWTTTNATEAEIRGTDSSVFRADPLAQGSKNVTPGVNLNNSFTVTYTITAKKGNQTAIASVTITTRPEIDLSCSSPPPYSLESNLCKIDLNQDVRLNWDHPPLPYGALKLVIDNDVGVVTADEDKKYTFRPSLDKVYTITAYGSGGNDTDAVTIEINPVSRLIINLPPKLIFTPNQLKFGGNLYNFNPNPLGFTGDFSKYKVDVFEISTEDTISDKDNYYQVIISQFKKNEGIAFLPQGLTKPLAQRWQLIKKTYAYSPPPAGSWAIMKNIFSPASNKNPFGFRLTFAPSNSSKLTDLINYLDPLTDRATFNAGFGTADCQTGNTHLCLETNAKFIPAEFSSAPDKQPTVFYKQAIALAGISVAGNVSGGGTLSNFKVAKGAIVVGGQIKASVSGETKLSGYIPNTKLEWDKQNNDDDLRGQIGRIYDKRTTGTEFTGNQFVARTWNLNSASSDPANTTATSFSAPPEGKLWYQKNVDNFTFNGDVKFSGSGTIAFTKDVTFNGRVECDQNTRLGIITTGNITFNTDKVECGAYVALDKPGLGQDIEFKDSTQGDIKGIFVAAGNIELPAVGGLIGPYEIRYDTAFAENPTVLFREILKLISTTAS